MTRIFLDTNIILDLLAERAPFYDSIAKLATLADQKKLTIIASPISFTTIDYVLGKIEPRSTVLDKLRKFKIICEVCEINDVTIDKGLNSNFLDFEDAIQYYGAIQANCAIIITRNSKDFKNATIPIMTSDQYLSSIL